MKQKWTKEENQKLINNFFDAPKACLLKTFSNRTWASIALHAYELGLKRNKKDMKISNLSALLQEDHTAYYWIGFILADGSIVNNRIKMKLAKKDQHHVEKFADFVGYDGNREKLSEISLMNSLVVPEICKKFDIKRAKTYNPPSLSVSSRFILSLIIGFIDGDGNIGFQYKRHDCSIRIKCHSSWIGVLQYFLDQLETICGVKLSKAKINKQGYAQLVIANNQVVKKLKQNALHNNLPTLSRKWDKIDVDFVNRTETKKVNKMLATEYFHRGMKKMKIAKTIGVSPAAVTGYLKGVV